ncbi:MAG: hypothetical protein HY282_05525 [Nitrospirae bacterium]|nr:hypothetical protein [Candidatus Manganitrophaceae bacterium]
MKTRYALGVFALAVGLFAAQTNLGWADSGHPDKAPAASKGSSKSADQNAAANCPPGLNGQLPSSSEQAAGIDNQTTGRRDQAVGNDSPLTKNSNKETPDLGHTPCPPADSDKGSGSSAGKDKPASKGGAQSEANPAGKTK